MPLEYCAGLFDGEGNISLHRHYTYVGRKATVQPHIPNTRYRLNICLNQTRVEGCMVLYDTFGGTLTFKTKTWGPNKEKIYSGRWWWEVGDKRAAEILTEMLPFLRIKKPEAELGILFQSKKFPEKAGHIGRAGRSRKNGRTPQEIAFGDWCFEEMKRLKHLHDTPAMREQYIMLHEHLRRWRRHAVVSRVSSTAKRTARAETQNQLDMALNTSA